jgi:uncharacterized protein YaaR (DUF327 family)
LDVTKVRGQWWLWRRQRTVVVEKADDKLMTLRSRLMEKKRMR